MTRRGGVSARNYVLHVDDRDLVQIEERIADERGVVVATIVRVSDEKRGESDPSRASRTACGRDAGRVNRAGSGTYDSEEICRACLRRRQIVPIRA